MDFPDPPAVHRQRATAVRFDWGLTGLPPQAPLWNRSRTWRSRCTSASGRELDAIGFGEDVDIAAEVDTSSVVPLLRTGVFVDATTLQS